MKALKTRLKNESGLTLVELIVVLVIIGLLFPTIFSLAGQASYKATKFLLMQEASYLAEAKIEEIIGFKSLNWDWYKTINKYAKTEDLGRGFQRTVTITKLKKWGKGKIDCWEVVVKVSHPKLENPFMLSVRLTKYYEIRP